MAEKKAIIVLAPAADLSGSGEGLGKLLKKGAVLKNFTAGNALEAAEGAVSVAPAGVAAEVEKGTALMVVDLGSAGSSELDAAVAAVLDGADRRTAVAVVTKSAAVLYGMGIDAKVGEVARAANARDILPTLAYIADFPITAECTGAILYQVLKTPNMKMEELGKLKEALVRMEGALARDNREPWDKHDCA